MTAGPASKPCAAARGCSRRRLQLFGMAFAGCVLTAGHCRDERRAAGVVLTRSVWHKTPAAMLVARHAPAAGPGR